MTEDIQRRRAAQIAEILATPDWDRVMRDTNCPSPSLIPDDGFAAHKSISTKRGGESAPWSEDPSPRISDRISRPGTIAHKAYHGLEISGLKLPEITADQQERIRLRREERRRER